jgi:hypothetical protein
MLVPEHGLTTVSEQIVIENEGLDKVTEGNIPDDLLEYWSERSLGGGAGGGHLAVDLDRVVHEGLEAIIRLTQAHEHVGDETSRTYRKSMKIALEAVNDWAGRYADAASEAARREPISCPSARPRTSGRGVSPCSRQTGAKPL